MDADDLKPHLENFRKLILASQYLDDVLTRLGRTQEFKALAAKDRELKQCIEDLQVFTQQASSSHAKLKKME